MTEYDEIQAEHEQALEEQALVRVMMGAEWLDEVNPGWFHNIDTDDLDIRNCSKCIIGQLYGGFHNLDHVSWAVYRKAESYGFDVHSGYNDVDMFGNPYPDDTPSLELKILGRLWVDLVKERVRNDG